MITCVIIDDEIGSIERLENLLADNTDIRVVAKEHIPELAVTTILRHRPELVFIDVEMPRMSGFEVVHEVRSRNCHPVFIFVTGYNQYAIRAIKDAVFDYVLKPIDVDDLKAAIGRYRELVKGKREEGRGKWNVIARGGATKQDDGRGKGCVLSDREKEVLKLVMQGKTSKEIANELFISKTTVDSHRRNILEKTGARNSTELIALALENRWV